jgi:hypothetical protein
MSALAPVLDRTPVTAIEEVVARLREIDAALPAADGVSCFNKLYLAVTTNVMTAEGGPAFADVAFLNALDVAFANLYFAALANLETGVEPPRAWAPLFAARARVDVAPLQFALAGMNAHINRDLPVALVATFVARGTPMSRPSPQAADFDRVNDLLAQTEATVAVEYFTPLMKDLHRVFDGVDDIVANWSVREARGSAWTNGAALWHLRVFPALSRDYLDALDGIVGFAGRGLLVPTG